MIFSHPDVASYLSDNFECAWESVRPVPRVEIDFGDGRTLTRTLNGNVATYFCTPDGRTFDLLPGLVDPVEYLGRAMAAKLLADNVASSRNAEELVRLVQSESGKHAVTALPVAIAPAPGAAALANDAAFNVKHRYPLARGVLSRRPLQTPRALQQEVFREVLKVDLADPYLGLAPLVLGGGVGRG